jgi:hypothetical protein
MKRSPMVALLMSGVLALGLVACGDDGDEKSTATTSVPTTAAPQGAPVVTIDLVDYAFQVSGPLVAGGTLKISNKGTEMHMVGLGRFKAGKTLADLQRALSEPPPTTSTTVRGATTTTARGATTTTVAGATTTTSRAATTTTVAGATTTTARAGSAAATTTTTAPAGQGNPTADILEELGLPGNILSPGESFELTVPSLQPCTYGMVCFLPAEGEGTPHFEKGMIGQLEVLPGTAPAVPAADATYKVAPGKAVQGPATLTAGRHVIKFEAAAGSEQLEPTIVRLNAGATFSSLDKAISALFEGDKPPAKGAAMKLPGQVVFGGFDLLAVTEFYVAVDLKAGNYMIVASDTDVPTPGTPKEILSVKVT